MKTNKFLILIFLTTLVGLFAIVLAYTFYKYELGKSRLSDQETFNYRLSLRTELEKEFKDKCATISATVTPTKHATQSGQILKGIGITVYPKRVTPSPID